MIDIHSHCLPDVDDGARNTEESIALLRDSRLQGVTKVVATPHCRLHHENSIEHFIERRNAAYDKIKNAEGLPEIILGAEVLLDHDISAEAGIKKLCIGDTDYMLTEFPQLGANAGEIEFEYLYNLSLIGIKPILAHVERYPKPEKILANLSGCDVIYQLNADGFLTFSVKRTVDKLIKSGCEFIVASDMHRTGSRPSHMKKAYEKAKKLYPDMAEKLFYTNAAKLFE